MGSTGTARCVMSLATEDYLPSSSKVPFEGMNAGIYGNLRRYAEVCGSLRKFTVDCGNESNCGNMRLFSGVCCCMREKCFSCITRAIEGFRSPKHLEFFCQNRAAKTLTIFSLASGWVGGWVGDFFFPFLTLP